MALGALALWAAIVTKNQADGLSRAGVQTSGHLRAVQSLSLINTSADALEVRSIPSELAKLRRAQGVLDDALDRMANGGIPEASRIAAEGEPIVRRMKPAIERYLANPPGYDSDGTAAAEEEMENIIEGARAAPERPRPGSLPGAGREARVRDGRPRRPFAPPRSCSSRSGSAVWWSAPGC